MNTTISVEAKATAIKVTDDDLLVNLADGRELRIPIVWFPRLLHSTIRQRNKYRLIGNGIGIHWPDLDEDISIAGLLAA